MPLASLACAAIGAAMTTSAMAIRVFFSCCVPCVGDLRRVASAIAHGERHGTISQGCTTSIRLALVRETNLIDGEVKVDPGVRRDDVRLLMCHGPGSRRSPG